MLFVDLGNKSNPIGDMISICMLIRCYNPKTIYSYYILMIFHNDSQRIFTTYYLKLLKIIYYCDSHNL